MKVDYFCQFVVAGGGNEVTKPPNLQHSQYSRQPTRNTLDITLSPTVSPIYPYMTSPADDDVMDHPRRLTRHVVHVELDKGVAGLGFCIDGGKRSLTGDQPVSVKKIFRCMYLDDQQAISAICK